MSKLSDAMKNDMKIFEEIIKLDVISSNIDAISYDTDEEKLLVTFKGGSSYEYFNVPQDVFDQLETAESKGSFMAKNIKGKFEYKKL